MKKTLLALAVMTAASSANAAVMYDDNGVTVTIKGDLDVHYIKTADQTQDAQIAVDDADFGFGLKYQVSEELAVGGALNIDGDSGDNNDEITVDEAFVGLMYGANTVTFGEQYTIRDDSGIGSDYEFGLSGAIDNAALYGPQVVKYVYDAGEAFYAGASLSMYENGASGRADGDQEVDVRLGYRVSDLDFTVYLGQSEHGQVEETGYILEVRYALDALELAATYGANTVEAPAVNDVDSSVIGFAGTYDINDKVTAAAGVSFFDKDLADDVVKGYVNTTYNFTSQVWTYAELGLTDEDNKDTAYVVGMGVKF